MAIVQIKEEKRFRHSNPTNSARFHSRLASTTIKITMQGELRCAMTSRNRHNFVIPTITTIVPPYPIAGYGNLEQRPVSPKRRCIRPPRTPLSVSALLVAAEELVNHLTAKRFFEPLVGLKARFSDAELSGELFLRWDPLFNLDFLGLALIPFGPSEALLHGWRTTGTLVFLRLLCLLYILLTMFQVPLFPTIGAPVSRHSTRSSSPGSHMRLVARRRA